MSQVGFETTIAVFERAKTFHALNRAATVLGSQNFQYLLKQVNGNKSVVIMSDSGEVANVIQC
jgi:hypothetical protein